MTIEQSTIAGTESGSSALNPQRNNVKHTLQYFRRFDAWLLLKNK